MKVEKITNSKVRITLTFEELIERNISLPDIIKDTAKVQQVFYNLFEETDLDEDFLSKDTQLLVEATTNNENLFILTVTKLSEDIIPDLNNYNDKTDITYKVSSNVYSFNSLDEIIEFTHYFEKESLYYGINKIYKHNNLYFLIFKNSTVNNKKFLKTFVRLSEHCLKYFNNKVFEASIIEKGTLIIPTRALQKLLLLNT